MNRLIPLLLSVVFISACVGGEDQQQQTVTGKGLEITGFSSDQSELQSGRTLRITMDVENSGGVKVLDSKSLAFLIAPGDWEFSSSDEYQHFGKDLKAADSYREIAADVDQVTWRLTAPIVPSGQTRTDEFEGRVYYEYETTVTGTVWLYSESEYESVRTAGGALSKASFKSSEGPVKIEASISPDPVVTGEDNIFTLNLKISNVGEGRVYRRSTLGYSSGDIGLDLDDLNKVDIVNINLPSALNLLTSDCETEQELIRGKDVSITCDIEVEDDIVAKQSFPIEVDVEYGYFKAKTLSVGVIGR